MAGITDIATLVRSLVQAVNNVSAVLTRATPVPPTSSNANAYIKINNGGSGYTSISPDLVAADIGAAAINGSASQAFTANGFTTTNFFTSTGAAAFLQNANYSASVNVGNTGYIEHYIAGGTVVEAAVNLGQFQYQGGSSASLTSGSATTSISFTAPFNCLIYAYGTAGSGGNSIGGVSLTFSGCTALKNYSNWASGSTLGVATGIFSATSGAAVSIEMGVSLASGTSVLTPTLIYNVVPSP